jgi:hypothetical protein
MPAALVSALKVDPSCSLLLLHADSFASGCLEM